MPTRTPAKPDTEGARAPHERSFRSGRPDAIAVTTVGSRLVTALLAAVGVTFFAAFVALGVALEPDAAEPAAPSAAVAPSEARALEPSEPIEVSGLWPDEPAAAASTAAPGAPSPLPATLEQVEALLPAAPAAALAALSNLSPHDEAEAQRHQALEVRALVGVGRIGAARTRAGVYYRRWPDGPHREELTRLTGRRPRP